MRSDSLLVLIFIGMLFFVLSGYCSAEQQFLEKMENGSINWTDGSIEAVGLGIPPNGISKKNQSRPMAIRAAKLDAMRNLLEVIKGVRIDVSTTVNNFITEDDVIMSEVDGIIRGAQVIKQEYLSNETVEITMRISMRGGFAEIILPSVAKSAEPLKPKNSSALSSKNAQIFTGLIVDARGLHAKPAMSIKIVDENDKEVYGSAYVTREYAVQQGMSGYAKDLKTAQANQRVADNPLIIKALKTKGPGHSDFIISTQDAARLRSVSDHLSFMRKCRVMIVLD